MKRKYKDLSVNMLLFTISGFAPKLLSFVLVPLYTNCLTTGDYGIADLITTTIQLLIPIFTIDIQDAVLRFSLDKDADNKDVLSIGLNVILKGTLILMLGLIIIAFLPFIHVKKSYLIFLFFNYIATSLYNTVSLFCRGIDKIKVLTVASIINSVVTLTSNIICLVFLKMGLNGYLFSYIIGNVFALIYIVIRADLFRYVNFQWTQKNKKLQQEMFIYSAPLIFNVIAWWVNNASDRYILSAFAGVAVSGVYSVAYKIPSVLSTFQGIFYQAWSVSAVREFDSDDSDGFIGNMFSLMNTSMVIACSVIMIIDIPFAQILYAKDFFEAWKYVPLLLVSVVFNAMALFLGGIYTAVKDTKVLSLTTIISAIINTIGNFLLIPFIGAYGAAIATVAGYFVSYLYRYIKLKKYISMKINTIKEFSLYILLMVQTLIASFGYKYIFIQIILLVSILLLNINTVKKIFFKMLKK